MRHQPEPCAACWPRPPSYLALTPHRPRTSSQALYAAAAAKNDTDKKAAGAAHKSLYSKAFAKFCAADPNAKSETCTNEMMKKMYGGATAVGARKAKKA